MTWYFFAAQIGTYKALNVYGNRVPVKYLNAFELFFKVISAKRVTSLLAAPESRNAISLDVALFESKAGLTTF